MRPSVFTRKIIFFNVGLGAVACGSQGTTATPSTAVAAATGAVACTVSAAAQPVCPSPAPSYTGQVEAIITNNCQVCHASGGIAAASSGGGGGFGGGPANANFENQDPNHRPSGFDPSTAHDWSVLKNIQADKTKMIQNLFVCTMPPPTASTLTDSDRVTLMEWLACGAPNN